MEEEEEEEEEETLKPKPTTAAAATTTSSKEEEEEDDEDDEKARGRPAAPRPSRPGPRATPGPGPDRAVRGPTSSCPPRPGRGRR